MHLTPVRLRDKHSIPRLTDIIQQRLQACCRTRRDDDMLGAQLFVRMEKGIEYINELSN